MPQLTCYSWTNLLSTQDLRVNPKYCNWDDKKVLSSFAIRAKTEKKSWRATRRPRTVQQGENLRIPLLSQGLKLLNSRPGCGVSVLRFSCEIDITNGFLTLGSFRSSAFSSFLFPDKPLLHCWKAKRGLKLSCNFRTAGKRPSSHP